ncbi:MAG: hypothetical protein ACOX38_10135 [Bacillota bacterium]|jgi:leucyl aminopeptidase (aminopeptidase T)
MDPRVWELTKTLVDYSVSVQDGDVVIISADLDGSQLVEAVYRRVLQRGGYPRNLLVNRADISATGSLAIMKRQYAVI